MKWAIVGMLLFALCACAEGAQLARARTVANVSEMIVTELDHAIALAIAPKRAKCTESSAGDRAAYLDCMEPWAKAVAAIEAAWAARESMVYALDTVDRQNEGNIGGTIGCAFASIGRLLKAAEHAGVSPSRQAFQSWRQYSAVMGSMCEMAGQGGTLGSGSAEVPP